MSFFKDLFLKTRHFALYGFLMAILVFALKWLQWKFLIIDNSIEIYVGIIAVLFMLLGIWVANQMSKPQVQTVFIEKEVVLEPLSVSIVNETELQKLNLSTREYEVLQLLAQGYSNAEIAERLFLSLSSIKTHVSNLFVKMDVKIRTESSEKAKRLNIII